MRTNRLMAVSSTGSEARQRLIALSFERTEETGSGMEVLKNSALHQAFAPFGFGVDPESSPGPQREQR